MDMEHWFEFECGTVHNTNWMEQKKRLARMRSRLLDTATSDSNGALNGSIEMRSLSRPEQRRNN